MQGGAGGAADNEKCGEQLVPGSPVQPDATEPQPQPQPEDHTADAEHGTAPGPGGPGTQVEAGQLMSKQVQLQIGPEISEELVAKFGGIELSRQRAENVDGVQSESEEEEDKNGSESAGHGTGETRVLLAHGDEQISGAGGGTTTADGTSSLSTEELAQVPRVFFNKASITCVGGCL